MDKRIIFLLICMANITISFNIAAVAAVVPVISLDLNLPDFYVSRIIHYYLLPYGIGALLYAPLTRYFSYKKILIAVLLMFGASTFYSAISVGLNQLLIGRVGMGLTAAGAIPLGLMIIGDLFEKKRRGRLVGLFFSCSFFGSLAGIVLSGIADWRMLFYVPAALALLTALSIVVLKTDLLNKVHGQKVNYADAFINIRIRNIFIFIFSISFLYHGVHKWYGVYLNHEYGLDKLTISLFFTLSLIGGAFGQILGGIISDKMGRMKAIRLGILGLGVSIILLAGHYSLYMLGIIIVTASMSWTIGHNGLSTVLTDFPDQDRPIIASLNSSVRFISGGLGFYFSAFFVKQSFGLTFLYIGILILLVNITIKTLISSSNK